MADDLEGKSEIWDSMNYTMSNTGYTDRARDNGIIEACGGSLPKLSFDNVVNNLKPYFSFDSMKGEGMGDKYVRGVGISSGIIVEVTYESESDLTKRLNNEEENELIDVLEGDTSDEDMSKLMELGGWSIPLISVKVSYSIGNSGNDLEIVRKALLLSGLERV